MKNYLISFLMILSVFTSCESVEQVITYNRYLYLGSWRDVTYIDNCPYFIYNTKPYRIPDRHRYKIRHFDKPIYRNNSIRHDRFNKDNFKYIPNRQENRRR